MKCVILAGGLGSRLSEETVIKPKPMVEIGEKPILWHIMKIYSSFGINDFIICLGYRGCYIREYFANYVMHNSDITISFNNNQMILHNQLCEPWTVTLVNTGTSTSTGGRLKRIHEYVKSEDAFCFTYGDGVGNIAVNDLVKFHNNNNVLVTVTAVPSPSRFGALEINQNLVTGFIEKPVNSNILINAGFFVMSPKALDFIENDNTSWEEDTLKLFIEQNQLSAFIHNGFWHPMDTLKDKKYLEDLWETNQAPWKIW